MTFSLRTLLRRLRTAPVTASLLLAAALLLGVLPLGPLPAHAEGPDGSPGGSGAAEVEYPGDPAREAETSRAEGRRLTDVASMVDSTRWAFAPDAAPLTLPSEEHGDTVVLLAREAPYTLEELADRVPDAVRRGKDGSYLISSHLVIDRGATLRIHDDSGLVVHLESTAEHFASIVSLGGSLDIAGGEDAPVEISGWDSESRSEDTDTADGRAYLRALAGSVTARDVDLGHLGFWSGPTGGLALTGSDAPAIRTADDEVVTDPEEASAVEPDPDSPVLLPDLDEEKEDRTVSASLERVSARDDAIGLFAANTAPLTITDSDFSDNLLDGVVLHRFVTAAELSEVTAHSNGGDGIRAGRGTTDVSIAGSRVSYNGGDGISLNGSGLADGPGATGLPTGMFGGHAVTGSTVSGNGRYGIQVTGGAGTVLRDNSVNRHTSGIVVGGIARGTEITGNRVRFSDRHGISLRDDVTDALIDQNAVSGADTAIYARGASGEISHNTVTRTTNHGITVIDQADTTKVSRNSLAGSGPSAIDTSRSGTSAVLSANSAANWEITKPLAVTLQRIFQPLTVLWLSIGALLLLSARAAVRRGPGRGRRVHPYADHTPLMQLSAGVLQGPDDPLQAAPSPAPAAHGKRRRRWPLLPEGMGLPADMHDPTHDATRGGLHR